MAPNLYLVARRMLRPDQWKTFNKKNTPSKVLLHQTTPASGIYCVNAAGRKFLVAIEPIIDRRDSEGIFEFEEFSTDHPPTTIKGPGRSINDTRPVYYRVLGNTPEVRYCKILDRYMLFSELEKRWNTCIHRDGIISYMFRLDNPYLYVSAGHGKIGKNREIPKPPKVPRYHKGIYEDLWSRDPVTTAYTRMKTGEAKKAREEMKEKDRDIWYENGSEFYMKVLRYLIEPIQP
ncbi:hypothetical protein DID88_007191 [Monilinia fructigena]|uniref:Uncharacterized protein n=1 Tax=Monilinia fructigena TaxID=38457 RepID=A0A395JA01_9HELO|nr:hypothetical protein DID88_007191 [Monilinia fructigena]